MIIYYNRDGSERFRGIKKNNKPFDGTFINNKTISNYLGGKLDGKKKYFDYKGKNEKIENYKNGKLNGKTYFYRKDKLDYTCEFKNGKPYSGKIKNQSGNFIYYKNGEINGEIKNRINYFTCSVNYVDGKKEGKCICWNKKTELKKFEQIDNFNAKPDSDTLFLVGTYSNDNPYSGVIVDKSSISEYKDGKKNGYSIKYHNGSFFKINSILSYKNDSLDGVSKYFIANNIFESTFDNGKIKNGLLIDEKMLGNWKENLFQFYENYQKIDKYYKYSNNYSSLILKNGKPYSGYSRRNNSYNFFDKYHNGDLIKTYLYNGIDTLWKTVYNGNTSETTNKKNEIIYKTNYTNNYDSGIANYYIEGKLINKIFFNKNKVVSGCLEEPIDNKNFMKKYENIKICKDSSALIIELEYKNKRIKEEYKIGNDIEVSWPFIKTQGSIYTLIYSSNNTLINYYDLITNNKLATYDSSTDLGIKINQIGNEFEVKRYINGEIKTHTFGYKEMILILKEWSKTK